MIAFLLVFVDLVRSLRRSATDPQFQAAGTTVAVLLVVGTFFYHHVEHWRWVDSLYFSVVALATVGFGDFTPKTDAGKIFTVLYIFAGVGALVGLAALVFKGRTEVQMNRRRRFARVELDPPQ